MHKKSLSLDDLPSIKDLSKQVERLNNLDPLARSSNTLQGKIESASSFLSANTDLLELQDRDLINSTRQTLYSFGLFSFIAPTMLSFSLGTTQKFQSLKYNFKVLARTSLFIPPLALFYAYYIEASQKLCLYEVNKYYERILIYQQTMDRSILNRNFEEEEIY